MLSDVQFYDKYSRFDYTTNQREDWQDTVTRVTDYLWSFDKNNAISDVLRKKIYDAIYNKDVMPSMRNLAMAGKAAERQNACSYNCAYTVLADLYAFKEAVIILMSGSGLGYSVEKRYINNLPIVEKQSGDIIYHSVEDTTEGWADAVYVGLLSWFRGFDVIFDYSKVRPAGTPLITKGGRASGPEILEQSLNKIREIILSAQNYKLRPIQAHDIMCHLAACIVSGGVRRSAMISLFDYDDYEMKTCKNPKNIVGNEQRYFANNSAVWVERKTRKEVELFMNTMFDSNMGEPGIFSRYAANKNLTQRRNEAALGTNPSLRKGTLVYTSNGIFPIETLEGKSFYVKNLNGELSPAECFLSGKNKPLYKITLSGGHEYYATKEHKWPVLQKDGSVAKVTTDNLSSKDRLPLIMEDTLGFGTEGDYNDGFLAGWIIGDGWVTTRSDNGRKQYGLILSQEDYNSPIRTRLESKLLEIGSLSTFQERSRDNSTWYEVNTQSKEIDAWANRFGILGKQHGMPKAIFTVASEQFRKGFIDAIISADGSIDTYGDRARVCITTSHESLARELSELLGFYGLKTSVLAAETKRASFPNGKEYDRTYIRWDVGINSMFHAHRFNELFTLTHPRKQDLINQYAHLSQYDRITDKSIDIVSVELTSVKEDVWDISVYDDTHCFQLPHCITGNCGEIFLRPFQFCNLSSVVCRTHDTKDSLKEKVYYATVIGTLQSMSENFPGLRPEWRRNQEEERLLGVDLNGIMDVPLVRNPYLLDDLREYAIQVNAEFAEKLGINQSVAVTCIKPSGNSSVFLDTSPGIHTRWSDYYIRRVELHKDNPVLQVLQFYGVPTEKSHYKNDTYIAAFPVKAPEGAITNGHFSAIEQLDNWKLFKEHWTEHNPSVTITYEDHEKEDIIEWVYKNQGVIGGLSFLPKSDAHYEQMPYEAITKEQYEELMKDFPTYINWETLHELERGLGDLTNASQLAACSGDKCLVAY